jgi:hypothetical protein
VLHQFQSYVLVAVAVAQVTMMAQVDVQVALAI